MREYFADVVLNHRHNFWDGQYVWAPRARILQVALTIFRKITGRAATFYWHKDGFMAEARDERGNSVIVTQVNCDSRWSSRPNAMGRYYRRGGPLALLPERIKEAA